MKKVFLLFGIAACSAVSAQEKDLFDIQAHLQKKQTEAKKIEPIKLPPLPFLKVSESYSNSYASNKPELTYNLSNGDKVITLGQDNMPCVVPDMNSFQAMPNTGREENAAGNNLLSLMRQRQPGKIPNGALPMRIIDSK